MRFLEPAKNLSCLRNPDINGEGNCGLSPGSPCRGASLGEEPLLALCLQGGLSK